MRSNTRRRVDPRAHSTEFEHEDACALFNEGHTIPGDIAEVVRTLRDMDGIEAAAGGCNTCTAYAMDHGVYYVAQGSARDSLYFGFTDEAAAHTLRAVCDDLGLETEWDGSVGQKVNVLSNL